MRLNIPTGDFAGYIFDLDGTLVDTMPLHYAAWDVALRQAGLNEKLSEDLFYSLAGVPTRRVAELIGEHYGLRLDPDQVFHQKEAIFTESLPHVALIKAVVDFARFAGRTRPLAIASGGPRPVVHRTLELSGLAPLFKVIVTPEDVERGKPAPDMFLLAAHRMGVPPGQCLVFEDAEAGIAAAKAAGMKWVFVPSRPEAGPPPAAAAAAAAAGVQGLS